MKTAAASNYARSLIEASLDPLVTISADGKIMDVNKATESITGITRDKLIGSDFSDYFTEPQKARDGYQLAFLQGMVKDYPLAICHVSGKITDVLYNATVYRDEGGNVAGLFAAARDVTALKRAQQELQDAILHLRIIGEMSDLLQSCQRMEEAYPIIRSALERLFPDSSGGVYIANADNNALILVSFWGNGKLETMFALDECWGMRRGRVHAGMIEASLNPVCEHVKRSDVPYICIPLLAHSHALGLIHIECQQSCPAQLDIQRKLSIAETAADSARLALANLILREELRALSIRDPLTGLFNRRFLEEALERELIRMNRAGKMLAVALVDVDHFKNFNDNYGHDAGDEVLKKVGELMVTFRQGNDIVCRYGGEEFVVVITEIEPAHAIARLDTLRLTIANQKLTSGGNILPPISVSIGVSLYPTHGSSRTELIRRADQAVYQAKEAGRNRLVVAESIK